MTEYDNLKAQKDELVRQQEKGNWHDLFWWKNAEVQSLRAELEKVKAERDEWLSRAGTNGKFYMDSLKENLSLRTELSVKDSALGDIADYQHRWSDSPITEVQKIARSILSQYAEEVKNDLQN